MRTSVRGAEEAGGPPHSTVYSISSFLEVKKKKKQKGNLGDSEWERWNCKIGQKVHLGFSITQKNPNELFGKLNINDGDGGTC